MKKRLLIIGLAAVFMLVGGMTCNIHLDKACAMSIEEAHKAFIYPVVRITSNYAGGSGTVVYSKKDDDGKYSTYVLTNHHVVAGSIEIKEEWDSTLGKEVKREKRSMVHVEVFKYRNLSTPVGTLKVEATIELYNEDGDMALVKLRSDDKIQHVATLCSDENMKKIHVLDKTIAVGCSLLCPPLPTDGILTRLNFYMSSIPYHMSSSQIIYGNSGGAMFKEDGELIGIPSRIAVVGWSTPITHMGFFIPIDRVYRWLEKEHYDFIFDSDKTEKGCMEEREKDIEAKKVVK